MAQLWEHVSTADDDLVEQGEVIRAKAEAWKAGPCEGGLQTMKNLSIFGLKLFFFIEPSLGEAR